MDPREKCRKLNKNDRQSFIHRTGTQTNKRTLQQITAYWLVRFFFYKLNEPKSREWGSVSNLICWSTASLYLFISSIISLFNLYSGVPSIAGYKSSHRSTPVNHQLMNIYEIGSPVSLVGFSAYLLMHFNEECLHLLCFTARVYIYSVSLFVFTLNMVMLSFINLFCTYISAQTKYYYNQLEPKIWFKIIFIRCQ